MNSGFLGPAIATVLTACGIETPFNRLLTYLFLVLQQYLPLAVLKPVFGLYRISSGVTLQQYLPLAVLKLSFLTSIKFFNFVLQQYLPLAVLKLSKILLTLMTFSSLDCNSTYRLRY